MKEETIKQIKAIIQECGSFSTFEVNADSSPSYGSLGKFFGVIEQFNEEDCTVIVYDDDSQEQDEFDVNYEDLEFDTLKEILDLCNDWQEMSDEEKEEDEDY